MKTRAAHAVAALVLVPLALGALLQSALTAFTSPRGPSPRQWPAWSIVALAMGMFVFALVFGLFSKDLELEGLPWFGLVFAGIGLGIGLRLTGRLPIVNEGILLSITSLYVVLTFWSGGGTLQLAMTFAPLVVPLAFFSVGAVVWLAFTRKVAPRWLKIVLYVWYLAASLTLAFVTVFLDLLPTALESGGFFALTLAGMLLCGFTAQGILLLLALYGWFAPKRREKEMEAAGWVKDGALFTSRFADDQVRLWQALILVALPPAVLGANAALGLARQEALVGLLLVAVPALGALGRRKEPVVLEVVESAPSG